MRHGSTPPATALRLLLLAVLLGSGAPPLSAQTLQGRLLDGANGRPIDLGRVVLLTSDGDSLRSTLTNRDGRFSLRAPAPGAYLLRASAWGYQERTDGVFELGEGGVMTVEFRIPPMAAEMEEILVSVDRPVLDHPLVLNGFVERYRRGIGHFITPRDLARSPLRETEGLFHLVPRVHVVPSGDDFAGGDRVMMSGAGGRCVPAIYVDGVRRQYDPSIGLTLSRIVPIGLIDAVEIYRGPAEVPVRYASTQGGRVCGVIVFWSKR